MNWQRRCVLVGTAIGGILVVYGMMYNAVGIILAGTVLMVTALIYAYWKL